MQFLSGYNFICILLQLNSQMNSYHHQHSTPHQLKQKYFANHKLPQRTQQQKISSPLTDNYHQNKPHSIAPSPAAVYNYPHEYKLQKNFVPLITQPQTIEINIKPNNVSQINKGIGSQTTVDRKFMPISFDKVKVPEDLSQESQKIEEQHTKETIKTVLIGFFILILIIGVFYGLILIDKSKEVESFFVARNSVANTSVNSKEKEWKALPQDEKSPLQILQDLSSIGDQTFHTAQQSASSSQSNSNRIHLRNHGG